MGRRSAQKGKLEKQFNKTTKEILILLLGMIIIRIIVMNMLTRLYTIQFFSPPNDQSAVSLQAAIVER